MFWMNKAKRRGNPSFFLSRGAYTLPGLRADEGIGPYRRGTLPVGDDPHIFPQPWQREHFLSSKLLKKAKNREIPKK